MYSEESEDNHDDDDDDETVLSLVPAKRPRKSSKTPGQLPPSGTQLTC